MKAIMCATLVSILVVAASGRSHNDDAKFDESKLLGKWEPTDVKKEARALLEFKKGGKLLITIPIDGVETVLEGSWKLKGADLEIGLTRNGMTETTTFKVLKLDDKFLEYTAPQGKMYSLKKLKN